MKICTFLVVFMLGMMSVGKVFGANDAVGRLPDQHENLYQRVKTWTTRVFVETKNVFAGMYAFVYDLFSKEDLSNREEGLGDDPGVPSEVYSTDPKTWKEKSD